MKAALLLAALLLAPATGAVAAQAAPDRAAFIRLAPSVLKVEAVDAHGRFHLGSGVVVGEARVVTNCHVTRRATRVSVVKGGVRWQAQAQASDIAHDLCVLHVPALAVDARPVSIAASASLAVGQPVMAIGYTGGGTLQLSEGEVVALHPWDGGHVVQSSNWFGSGASGGGLFDADGALVGILTFRLRGGAQHYFAAPTEWLRAPADDPARYATPAPLDGTAFWEQPPAAQPYFLQAATLEQRRDWQPLRELAQRWSREAPREPEAAYALALADEALGRDDDALQGFSRCLQIDPRYMRGWQRLARLQHRLGRRADLRGTIDALWALDAGLARLLGDELGAR